MTEFVNGDEVEYAITGVRGVISHAAPRADMNSIRLANGTTMSGVSSKHLTLLGRPARSQADHQLIERLERRGRPPMKAWTMVAFGLAGLSVGSMISGCWHHDWGLIGESFAWAVLAGMYVWRGRWEH